MPRSSIAKRTRVAASGRSSVNLLLRDVKRKRAEDVRDFVPRMRRKRAPTLERAGSVSALEVG